MEGGIDRWIDGWSANILTLLRSSSFSSVSSSTTSTSFSWIYRSNTGALNLYEKLGFYRDKRLLRYYLNGGDAFRLKLWFPGVAYYT